MKVSALVLVFALAGGEPLAQAPPQRADDTPPGVPTTPVEPSGTSTPRPTSPVRTGGRGAAVAPPASTAAPTSTPAAVAPAPTPPPSAPNSIQADPVVQPPTLVEPVSWWRWVWLFMLLKLASLLALVFLWTRRRARANVEGKAPAGEPPPVPWLAPRVTFVPRLDAGRQTVTAIDGRGGHSYELAYHIDPGTQHMRYQDTLERVGAPS